MLQRIGMYSLSLIKLRIILIKMFKTVLKEFVEMIEKKNISLAWET